MTGAPRVLVVGHDASRTGAPIVATSLVRWATATGAAQVRVALLAGGPLASELGRLAPTSVASAPESLLARATGASAHRARLAVAARAFDRPPIVVANTVAAWAAAATVSRRSALVCWVHELDHVAEAIVPADRRPPLIAATDRFVAAGAAVGEMLVERWGVDPARVAVVDPFVDPPDVPPSEARLQVLGAGSLVPRKGADAFVATLASLRQPLPAGAAAWVGGPVDGAYAEQVRADLGRAGLEAVVSLPGSVPSLAPWWPTDGVLLHPAREDPAPLVVLEAALRGVPVVTWRTGGAAELLEQAGCAHLVAPAGDLVGLADRLGELLAQPAARTEAGRALAEAAAHRVTAIGAPRTLDAIVGGP